MKKRFLIVGDNHIDNKVPMYRVDNYLETSLEELKETLIIATAAKADYYVLLGDVFNRIEVSGDCRNKVIKTFASNNGVPWNFKKYCIVGNHDIAHNPDYLEKSALTSVFYGGDVECVEKLPDLPVRFFHFEPNLDEKLRKGELENYDDEILFLHASIVDKPARFEHVLFDDLKLHSNTKLVISGHIHGQMQAINRRGAKFINPGSVGRTETSERHQPQVLLLEYDFEKHTYETVLLQLKNSLPYDLIFDIEKSTQKKEEDKNTQMFLEAVTSTDFSDNLTGNLENDFRIFADKRQVENIITNIVIDTMRLVKTGGHLDEL
jgi:DNA repair exonuclease SbcCD nuclease subunit